MGVKNVAAGVAKAPFKLVGNLAGWENTKAWWNYTRGAYRALRNPDCPECGKGHLVATQGEENLWLCSNDACTFNVQAATLEEAEIKVAERQKEIALAQLKEMNDESNTEAVARKENLLKARRFQSRFYFTLCLLCFVGFLYIIASGGGFSTSIAWMCFCGLFGVYGLRESYRHWQIANSALFQEGAPFKEWFKTGKWFI